MQSIINNTLPVNWIQRILQSFYNVFKKINLIAALRKTVQNIFYPLLMSPEGLPRQI